MAYSAPQHIARHQSSWTRLKIGAVMMVLALVTTLISPFAGLQAAQAAPNNGIQVTNATLVKVLDANASAELPGAQLYRWEYAKFTFNWDGTNANLQSGDSFTLRLPSALSFGDSTAPVKITMGSDPNEFGTCQRANELLTCTFNQRIDESRQAGNSQFRGSGEVVVQAVEEHNQNAINVRVNDTADLNVNLPAGQPITERPQPYEAAPELDKETYNFGADATELQWQIIFGTEKLAQKYREAGIQRNFDGHTPHTLTFTDVLGPGMDFNRTPGEWHLQLKQSSTDPRPFEKWQNNVATGEGPVVQGFSLDVQYGQATAAGTPVTITATGPFKPNANYQIHYKTTFSSGSGKIVHGVDYQNAVTLTTDQLRIEKNVTRSYVDSATVNIEMEQGYGSFNVSKKIVGRGADQVQAGQKFPVTVNWLLPNGNNVDNWPDFTPPAGGQLNAERTGGTASFEVPFGGNASFPTAFPQGTIITLSENLSGVVAPDGLTWGAPAFSNPTDGTPVESITIGDQTITKVTLTNKLEDQPKGSFKVKKALSGDYTPQPGETFEVTYTCTNEDAQGTLNIPATGAEVQGPTLKAGTTCTITENGQAADRVGYDRITDHIVGNRADVVVTIRANEAQLVTVSNHYTRKSSVSVGDLVWIDEDDDGLQKGGETGIGDVQLILTGPDGQQVTDIEGHVVAPQRTTEEGLYSFDKLPVLQAGQSYKVTIDMQDPQTVAALLPYTPAKVVQGADRAKDSSTGSANSEGLTENAQRDDTLDFGFVRTVPRIDIEKYTGAWGGVQYTPENAPILNLLTNQPQVLPVGDYDTAAAPLVLKGAATTPITFTVSNTGTSKLTKVTVSDQTASGPAIEGLYCTFVTAAGEQRVEAVAGVVTAPDSFVLEPKATVTCAGTLPALQGEAHANTATVEASPIAGGSPVRDTDDFHAKRAEVSVGDFVWVDDNANGLQDNGEPGIANVWLKITGPAGDVTDINGTVVAPVKTGANGQYTFEHLPVLGEGEFYTVTIDMDNRETVNALLPYKATKELALTDPQVDREQDSSTGSARTIKPLKEDKERDPSLDFGFIRTVPGIDIEKHTGAWAGVQFAQDGSPILSDNNQPAQLPIGDHDTADNALVISGEARTPITFTVTNTGSASLKSLIVSDQTSAGPQLQDITCEVKGEQFAADTTGTVVVRPAIELAPAESFTCSAVLPALGEELTHTNVATVEAQPVAGGNPVTDTDPFNAKRQPKVSVGNYVFEDVNKDGLQDAGDRGIENVTVTISRSDGQPVKKYDGTAYTQTQAQTNTEGLYLFRDLEALSGNVKYVVTIDNSQPALLPFNPTKVVEGADPEKDSSVGRAESYKDLSQDKREDLSLDFGFIQAVPTIDIEKYTGEWAGVTFNNDVPALNNGQPQVLPIGDHDTAADALVIKGAEPTKVTFTVTNTGTAKLHKVTVSDQTTAEPALENLQCTFVTPAGSVVQQAADGVVTAPAGFVLNPKETVECEGTLPALTQVDPHSNTASVEATPIAGGEPVKDTDEFHAKRAKVSVGDYVWEDVNKDGLQDVSDIPLKDVELTISRSDKAPVKNVKGQTLEGASAQTTTDAAGKYSFDNLEVLPDTAQYVVSVKNPRGFLPTLAQEGADREKDSSTGFATARKLSDGQRDASLDFGFIRSLPAVDIEKFTGTWDGVTFTGDKPNLANGQPQVLPIGDHDTIGEALTVNGGEETDIAFLVTNTGNDGLVNVTVSDKTSAGPALKDLQCTFGMETVKVNDGGLVVAPATFTLAPKATVACTATLPALTVDAFVHSNEATVVGTPSAGGEPVTDRDPFHAKVAKVSVGDYVWEDLNKDGIQDDGEPGIPGVQLTLVGPNGQPVRDVDGNPVGAATTNAHGQYSFDKLPALAKGQTYTVLLDVKDEVNRQSLAGFIATAEGATNDHEKDSSTGRATTVKQLSTDNERDPSLDFGFYRPTVSVGDYVWNDLNKDGLQDKDEPGIGNVLLKITGPDNAEVRDVFGQPVKPVRTAADGSYHFGDLPTLTAEQTYTVSVVTDDEQTAEALKGMVPTKENQGEDREKDSSTGSAKTIKTLTNNGIHDPSLDFGYFVPTVSVGDFVWEDTNKNGIQDKGEPGLKDVVLTIHGTDGTPVLDKDGKPRTATTDKDGMYSFDELPVLPAGKKYTVKVDKNQPALKGYTSTKAGAGNDPLKDSSTDSADTIVDLTIDGDRDPSLDFGFVKVVPPATPPLAHTGANVALAGIAAFSAAALGILAVRRKRR